MSKESVLSEFLDTVSDAAADDDDDDDDSVHALPSFFYSYQLFFLIFLLFSVISFFPILFARRFSFSPAFS